MRTLGDTAMWDYAYLLFAVGLGVVGLVLVYIYQRRRSQTEAKHGWMSYVLVWPKAAIYGHRVPVTEAFDHHVQSHQRPPLSTAKGVC